MGNVLNPRKTQFETMIANAQGTAGLLDAQGRVLYLSGPLLGYSLDEMRGRSLLEGVHPEDLPHAEQWFAHCLDQPSERIRVQLRKIHNDGSIRVVEAVMVNKLSDPEIGAIVLQCLDITERTAVEVVSASDLRFLEKICFVLSESLEYEAAIHKVVDLTVGHLGDWCSVDLIEDGSIQRVATAHSNPNLLKLAEKVIETGETVCVSQLTTEQLASMDSKDREILQELDICSYVATPLKARERVLGVLSATRSRDSRQYDSRDLALIKDVATQIALHVDKARLLREAQRAQKQSDLLTEVTTLLAESFDSANILQRLARNAVQNFAEYCFVHRFTANGRLYRAAGAHADPEMCATVNKLLGEQEIGLEGQEYIQSFIDKNVPSLTRDGGHLASRMSDGVYKDMIQRLAPHSWIIAPLVARGNRLGAILLARSKKRPQYTDNDLRFVEELARRAAIAIDNERLYRESQEASRLKDQFVATISHELRTPLTVIAGWTAVLQKHEVDQKTIERALAAIQRNVTLQTSLVDDLLDVSRIVSGKMRLDVKPVDLCALVESSVENMKDAAAAKAINIAFLTEGTIEPIACDPDRIQQVLWNLLSNSIKFTPPDGSIQVVIRSNQANEAEIIISDTGVGIVSEFLPFVFDRFRQFDGSTTRKAAGLGLGLSIVKHLVELHGGMVHAESAGKGQGASFRVVLPRSARRVAALSSQP